MFPSGVWRPEDVRWSPKSCAEAHREGDGWPVWDNHVD